MNIAVGSMMRLLVGSLVIAVAAGGTAQSQQTPPAPAAASGSPAKAPAKKSSAQADAGEPRADTSAPPPNTPAEGTAPAPGTAPAAPGGPAASSARNPRAAAAARAPATTGQRPPGAADRVDLSTATVTGDREQPKVMYIVPWKKSDIGDLSGKPMNSLLDEALAPVDREVFKREVAYYDAVKADMSQNGAPKTTPAQGEK